MSKRVLDAREEREKSTVDLKRWRTFEKAEKKVYGYPAKDNTE